MECVKQLADYPGCPGELDLLQNIGGLRRPDEWSRLLIVLVDVGTDRHEEFFYVAEDSATQSPDGAARESFIPQCETPGTTAGSRNERAKCSI